MKRYVLMSMVDFSMLLAFSFLLMWIQTLILINEPTEEAKGTPQSGAYFVELVWDVEPDADIDLHCKTPDESVCFFRKRYTNGTYLTLDDTGKNTVEDENYEKIVVSLTSEGEYIIYLHAYRLDEPVNGTINLYKTKKDGTSTLLIGKVFAISNPDEIWTFCRFELDDRGDLVPNSIDDTLEYNLQ